MEPTDVTSPLWRPSPERSAASAMARFRDANGFESYLDLHRWSVREPEAFWASLWDATGLPPDRGARVVDRGSTMAETRFFPDARLNVAEIILDGRGAPGDAPMYVGVDERGGASVVWTRDDVRAAVGEVASALRSRGVTAGDRVAAWLPNIAETMIAMLASASIGAVFCSTSPDFGVDGVLDRFGQIEPVVLFGSDGYSYGGKSLDCLERLATIRDALPTVRDVVVVGNRAALGAAPVGDLGGISGAVTWDDFRRSGLEAGSGSAIPFERFAFDHPWYVLFSSGTTGVPKCIVHRTGGVLLQHLKEHQLHCDIRPGDRVAYYTTCGWMMWNWLASVPASGATAVLYDGSPFQPGPEALVELAERERLTFLGVSAKYLDSVRKSGFVPKAHAPIAALRTIASTGSPLSPETNAWAAASFPDGVHIASISGGTDLCGCFVAGDPTSPAYAGEIQRPALGMAVDIVDETGNPSGVGERGELVCTEPFPSMPLGFWNDADGSRYRAAYFDAHPGIWSHGDFASWTEHGGIVVHGRSDTTLNPGGVRIGTAEIYRRVEQIDAVVESLVFGQDWEGDSRIVLLVRLAEGVVLDDDLVATIKHTIRVGCTPRHVPALVLAVHDLPRTRSGKLAELAVSDVVNGREVRNTTALANPETLPAIAALPGLRH